MNKTTKWLIGIVLVIILIAVGYSMTRESNVSTTNEPIKIGIATILSGDIAAFGENLVNVAELAVKNINSSGGVNGRMIELVVEDTACDSKTGLSAVQKLIDVDNVNYIIGGMCSNGTLAAAPVANENKVIIITPSTGGRNIDEAGEYIFRLGNSDLLVGRDIADTMKDLGYSRVGVVAESTEYTIDIKNTFKEYVAKIGLSLTLEEEFQPGTTDFRTIAAKIKAADLDAILIASQTGVSGGNLINQMRVLGADVPIFSDFLLLVNTDVEKLIGSFEGISYADPAFDANDPELVAFFSEYERVYGEPPLAGFFSAGTYDSIQMIVKAIEDVGDDSSVVRKWLLKNVQKWDGFMGEISLDENGNADTGFTVKKIINGEAVVYTK